MKIPAIVSVISFKPYKSRKAAGSDWALAIKAVQ